MNDSSQFFGCFVMSDDSKDEISKMSECQINMMAELIAESIRETQAEIRNNFKKE